MKNLKAILEARGYQVTYRSDSFGASDTGATIELNWLTATKGDIVVKHFWSGEQEHISVDWIDLDRVAEGCRGVPDEADYPMFTEAELCELLDSGAIIAYMRLGRVEICYLRGCL